MCIFSYYSHPIAVFRVSQLEKGENRKKIKEETLQ